jgi:hypothetical protein
MDMILDEKYDDCGWLASMPLYTEKALVPINISDSKVVEEPRKSKR